MKGDGTMNANFEENSKVTLPNGRKGIVIYALPDAALVEYSASFVGGERKITRCWFEYSYLRK